MHSTIIIFSEGHFEFLIWVMTQPTILQVIEYIQFLQEKVQKYEGSYIGWNQEATRLMPWVNSYTSLSKSIVVFWDHVESIYEITYAYLLFDLKLFLYFLCSRETIRSLWKVMLISPEGWLRPILMRKRYRFLHQLLEIHRNQ